MCELAAEDLDLLRRLIAARGPSGREDEVRAICREVLEPVCDETWEDPVGNLVSVIRCADAREKPLLIVSHMDEIAMMVKRVEADGRLAVTNLGGDRPMSFGQCAVDVMADRGPLVGILSLGSLHRTTESSEMAKLQSHGADWEDVFVITGLDREHVIAAGVHPGAPVVLSAAERHVVEVGDLLGAHFMDDRALLLAGMIVMRALRRRRSELRRDVYYVCSVEEEVTNSGAEYAARTLPGDQIIALEVGPVAQEYETELSCAPILSYGDEKGLYSSKLVERLRAACEAEGTPAQLAVLQGFASDASASIAAGLKPQAAVMCAPTQNTHGFEAIHKDAIGTFAAVLTRFVLD